MPRILIKDVRLSFPNLFTPKAQKAGDKPSCGASFLMPPDHPDVENIKAAISQAATDKWGPKANATLNALAKQDRVCLHDGAVKALKYDGYDGMLYVSARNQNPVDVRDRDPKIRLSESSGRPYAGCYVNALIDIYAQDNNYGQRINATLVGVQFKRDGDAFAGGAPADDDEFEKFEGEDISADDEAFFGAK